MSELVCVRACVCLNLLINKVCVFVTMFLMIKDDDAFSLFLQKPKIAYPTYPFGYTRER